MVDIPVIGIKWYISLGFSVDLNNSRDAWTFDLCDLIDTPNMSITHRPVIDTMCYTKSGPLNVRGMLGSFHDTILLSIRHLKGPTAQFTPPILTPIFCSSLLLVVVFYYHHSDQYIKV